VVEIFARVRKEIPAKLLMIGDGPERTAAEWLVRDKDLVHDVLFLGKQNQVQDLLCCADVALLPSDLESFGLVALEAMACAVPCVCSKVGGLVEVLQDGVEGFLVKPRDVDTMAARALDILTDDNLHQRMGDAGRHRALTQFCASKIIPQYEDLYRRTIEGK